MTNCPICGTANQEGSRFCSACGATLPTSTGIRCPMCGKMNPLGNVFCDHCSARLVPLTPDSLSAKQEPPSTAPEQPSIKPFSLPTIPLEEKPAAEEDWLAGLRQGVSEEEAAVGEEMVPMGLPDWLSGAEAEEPTVPPAAVPDWLAGLTQEEPAEAALPEVGLPDWLRGAEAEEPTVPPAAAPDWLAGLTQEEPAEAAPPEVGLPDWLSGAEAEEPIVPPAAAPDWLAGLTQEEPTEAAPPEVGLPDWLSGAEAGEKPAVPVFTTPAGPGTPTSGLPDWLLEVPESPLEAEKPPTAPVSEVPDWLAKAQPRPAAESAPSPLSGLPDWLVGAESTAPPKPPEPPFTAPIETAGIPDWLSEAVPPSAAEEISLDWLTDLAKAEEGIAPIAPPPFVPVKPPPEAEGLVRGEIPAWLEALRPKTEAEAAAEEPPETAGLLEGIRGTLVPSSIVDMPPDAKPTMPGAPSAAAIARSQLLQELLGRPAFPPLEIQEERGRRYPFLLRIGIGLVIVAAIIVPMFLSIPFFGIPAMPAADNFFAVVEQHVAADTPVLVAFEYGPADADEMDWVALPVLRHILERGGRLIVVSTQPEGPATAERVLARLLPDARMREERVANLGYQPGQVAGIQSLLTSLSERVEVRSGLPAAESPAMSGVSNAGDVQALIILTARADDLRYWVEQTTATYPGVTLLAGLSARVETTALPYLAPQAEQLQGSIAGLVGAAAYERNLGGGELQNIERFYLPSLGAVQLAVAALLLAGMLGYLLRPGGKKP